MYKNAGNTKKGFQKRLMKGIKIFLKNRKIKSKNIVASNIKNFLKMKNKGQLSIGKTVLKCGIIKTN